MACFIVPLTQAVVVSTVRRNKLKSNKEKTHNPWISQLPKLELMLWGGSLMLILDHFINGELMLRFPFFSALAQDGGIYTMLREMLIIGLPMSILITLIYGGMVFCNAKAFNNIAYSNKQIR